jgi:putative membrane protein insertion efficiency factor
MAETGYSSCLCGGFGRLPNAGHSLYCEAQVRGSYEPRLRWLHFGLAVLVLALLGIFTRFRSPALVGLSAAPALMTHFMPAAAAYNAAAILAFVLPVSAEWLLKRSRGSRYLWPPITALVASIVGGVLAGLCLGASPESLLLVGGMVTVLPWFPCASAIMLATSGQSGQRRSLTTSAVTTAILSGVRSRLTQASNRVSGKTSIMADLLSRFDRLERCLPRLSLDQHQACREALLTAQALLDVDLVEDARQVFLEKLADQQLAPNSAEQLVQVPKGFFPERPSPFVRHGIALIHTYRRIIPEDRRRACRFEPTCSNYVEAALLQRGFLAGLLLSLKRALRCVPYGDNGWDPVPNREPKRNGV